MDKLILSLLISFLFFSCANTKSNSINNNEHSYKADSLLLIKKAPIVITHAGSSLNKLLYLKLDSTLRWLKYKVIDSTETQNISRNFFKTTFMPSADMATIERQLERIKRGDNLLAEGITQSKPLIQYISIDVSYSDSIYNCKLLRENFPNRKINKTWLICGESISVLTQYVVDTLIK